MVRDHVRLAALLSGALAAFIGLSACASEPGLTKHVVAPKAANQEPLKIGFIVPLSGRLGAAAGNLMLNGLKLFLEENNYEIAGRKVDLIVEDDNNSSTVAVGKVRKLVDEDHVQVIAGGLRSVDAIAHEAELLQVPTVLAVVGPDDMSKRFKWTVQIAYAPCQPTHPFGQWAYQSRGYRKIATVAVNFPSAWQMVGGFQRSFEDAGGKIVQKIWLPGGSDDFSAYINSIAKDVDAIFVVTYADSSDIFARQIKQLRPHLPILAFGASYQEHTLKKVGDATLGVVSSYVYAESLNTQANKHFVAAFNRRFGTPPDALSEHCYTAGLWIKKALESFHADINDKDALLAALKKVELPDAPRGPIKLDSYGLPVENIYVREVQKVSGQLQNTVIHTFPKVSPFWTYAPEKILAQPYSRDFPGCRFCQNP